MRLSALFSDHMVLQRDLAIPVWGWAAPGEAITVELAGKSAKATAGADGRFGVSLPALPAGGPHTLVVRGAATVTVRDVLIGDVWVCSGQSNMEWPLEMSTGGAAAIAESDRPTMRLFTVPKRTELLPAEHVSSLWHVCSPLSTGGFSAVAYFFGREMQQRLNVPVGLINTSWGGTPAQAWTSREGLAADPKLAGYLEELRALDLPVEVLRAKAQAARAEFLAKLPKDAGNRGLKEGWAGRDFDDAAWKTMKVPEYWVNAGHPTNGVFWFRKTVEVPAGWAAAGAGDAQLSLGAADKSDDTYVNGVRVGGMSWAEDPQSWSTPRNYVVPAGVLKPGRNVIAVRVMSNYTGGGLAGPGAAMQLHGPEGGSAGAEASIALAGAWRYSMEQDFGRVTGIAEPQTLAGAHSPTMLFNGMIAPLLPYGIRGAIWYQGESNAGDAARYRTLFPAMIRDWRKRWKQGDFPFYFVQLANFMHEPATRESDNSRWAELREAQTLARSLPKTGMAVTIDIGEARDIHPRNKRDVGVRLALCALAEVHGEKVACYGPRYRSMKVAGGAVRVAWDHAEGLRSRAGGVRGFGVAGADRVFHAAEGKIEGAEVVVSSGKVAAPVAVRYGWADCPESSLENGAGLPAEPFRSDDWAVGAGIDRRQG